MVAHSLKHRCSKIHFSKWIVLFNLCCSPCLLADQTDELLAVVKNIVPEKSLNEGYIVNFNDVSVIEVIRFASKSLGVNFVFHEEELQFKVTIVSEEPISGKNLLSTLLQVLRIHNLRLLGQDNSLIITSNNSVNQIPQIVSETDPSSLQTKAPIVTRIFRLKNSNPISVATIIRPMLSESALIETMGESKQLIVSDVNANIDQVATLLLDLDSPQSALEVEVYECKHLTPAQIIPLASQILEPFKEGQSLQFVPHPLSNAIFVVSTPYLVERSLSILEDLDTVTPTSGQKQAAEEKIFIYQIENQSPTVILQGLKQIASEMELSKSASKPLLDALSSVKWIKESHSLLFFGSESALENVKGILTSLDTPTKWSSGSTFYLFPLRDLHKDQVDSWLTQLADKLETAPSPDHALIEMIRKRQWIPETNSFVFTGNEASLKKIEEILTNADFIKKGAAISSSQFFIYNPVSRKGEEIVAQLQQIASNLSESGLADPAFLKTLLSMRWVPESNSIIFTGDSDSLEKLKPMLESIDKTGHAELPSSSKSESATSFFLYKPSSKTISELKDSLKEITKNLQASALADPDLLHSLTSYTYVESTNSLLFTGSESTLAKVQELLNRIDRPSDDQSAIKQVGEQTFLVYKLLYVAPAQLISSLKAIAGDLERGGKSNQELSQALNSMKWIPETNSLLFIGTKPALEQIENLAKRFDIPSLAPVAKPAQLTPAVERTSDFVLYTPQYQTGCDLINLLKEFQKSLSESGVVDKALFDTFDHLQWVESTDAIIISGDKAAIAKTEDLLRRFDIPSKETDGEPSIQNAEASSFLVYKLQFHQGSAIKDALKQVATTLVAKDNVSNNGLLEAVNSMQWIQVTNSLIGTGQPSALSKLRELIRNLDVQLKQVFIEVLILQTTLNNTQTFGLQWGGKAQYLNKLAAGTSNIPTTAGTPLLNTSAISATRTPQAGDIPFATQGFDLGVIGDIILHKGKSFISLGALVDAIQQDTDSVIVMNPKIITQDNKNSTIFVGNNVPFVGSVVNNQQSNSTLVTTSLEYRDIGVNLSITPVLSSGEVVTLDIANDISQVASTTVIGTTGVQGINTSHTNMNTRVTVPNKHFLILSGMLQDTKNHTRTQIPCLGGLPLIGAAFSDNNRQDQKQNVLIFIRPYIINSFDDYQQVTENQEALLHDHSGPPVIVDELEDGLEWIKSPANE